MLLICVYIAFILVACLNTVNIKKGKQFLDLNYPFPFQIADFGLSKWRMMSLSQSRSSKSVPEGGTIVYMPPENYEPGQKARASVKHDIYRYSMLLLLRVRFA